MNARADAARRDTIHLLIALTVAPAATAITQQVAPSMLPELGLGLTFPRPTGRAADAFAVLITNGRVLALIAGATVLACTLPATANWLATVLAGVASLNVAMVCLAIADDGDHVVLALLPHGPVELLAYSLAGAGFMHARRHGATPDIGLLTHLVGGAFVLLALAAVLEVMPA